MIAAVLVAEAADHRLPAVASGKPRRCSSSSRSAAAALAARGSRRLRRRSSTARRARATVLDVWRVHLADGPSSGSLDYPGGGDVLATRAGKIALSRDRRFVLGERFVGTLAIAHDGRRLAARDRLQHRRRRLGSTGQHSSPSPTRPATPSNRRRSSIRSARCCYKFSGSIRFLRFSPDGQRLAFVQDSTSRGVSGQVAVMDLKGTVTELTERGRASAAWRGRRRVTKSGSPPVRRGPRGRCGRSRSRKRCASSTRRQDR